MKKVEVFWEVLSEIIEELKVLGLNPTEVEITVEKLQGGGGK
jgi:hypothetical protein